jgi:hypothetical protein
MTKVGVVLIIGLALVSGVAAFTTLFHDQPTRTEAQARTVPWLLVVHAKNPEVVRYNDRTVASN